MKAPSSKNLLLLVLLTGYSSGCATAPTIENDESKSNSPTPTISAHTESAIVKDAVPVVPMDKDHLYAGEPKGSNKLTILTNSTYLVGYDEDLKAPRWVAYRLFKIADVWQHVTAPSRDGISFKADARTSAKVTDADYDGIGKGVPGDSAKYDRGHMAPNSSMADCYGTNGQEQTFLLSNITIQKHTLNGETWAYLEAEEEDGIANYYTNVWIIDGPIFDAQPQRFGKANIAVPTAFYKILLVETNGEPGVEAVIMSQQVSGELTNNLKTFTTVKAVEAQTGLTFFGGLSSTERKKLETENIEFALPPKQKSSTK